MADLGLSATKENKEQKPSPIEKLLKL
jgi:hypothetical protein